MAGTEQAVNSSRALLSALASSPTFRNYRRAFQDATGMPLSLRSPGDEGIPYAEPRIQNSFCAMLSQKYPQCAACLQLQQRLASDSQAGPRTLVCQFGLTESAVPIQDGRTVIGILQTGQVFQKKPGAQQFRRTAEKLLKVGIETDDELKTAYFATPVVSSSRYEATVDLLTMFAGQLSTMASALVIRKDNSEPPTITAAKRFINDHLSEELSLRRVARAANTSPAYFCRLFKKATGINYNQYVARVRLESAKRLLAKPNKRISEIAFEVGFQSLTHFNRVFRKLVGKSPSEYREAI